MKTDGSSHTVILAMLQMTFSVGPCISYWKSPGEFWPVNVRSQRCAHDKMYQIRRNS